jgi:multidrug transporter EmrE-like cation transporter
MTNACLFAIYTAMSVLGLLLIKIGAPALRNLRAGGLQAVTDWLPLIQLGLGSIFYIGAFAVWILIISRVNLTVAYPVAVGLTLSCLTLAGVLVLNETVGPVQLIFAGILLVTRAAPISS